MRLDFIINSWSVTSDWASILVIDISSPLIVKQLADAVLRMVLLGPCTPSIIKICQFVKRSDWMGCRGRLRPWWHKVRLE